jgi:hypothetical protein
MACARIPHVASPARLRSALVQIGSGGPGCARLCFAFVVDQLARSVPAGHAVAACDEGAWAMVGRLPCNSAYQQFSFAGFPAILWTYRADAATGELAAAGMTGITCLIHQNLVPG